MDTGPVLSGGLERASLLLESEISFAIGSYDLKVEYGLLLKEIIWIHLFLFFIILLITIITSLGLWWVEIDCLNNFKLKSPFSSYDFHGCNTLFQKIRVDLIEDLIWLERCLKLVESLLSTFHLFDVKLYYLLITLLLSVRVCSDIADSIQLEISEHLTIISLSCRASSSLISHLLASLLSSLHLFDDFCLGGDWTLHPWVSNNVAQVKTNVLVWVDHHRNQILELLGDLLVWRVLLMSLPKDF